MEGSPGFLGTAVVFDLSLREQCIGPLYMKHGFKSLGMASLALVLCILYGVLFTPDDDTAWMAVLGAVVGLLSALAWVGGRYAGPFHLWGAVFTLAAITSVHAGLTWMIMNVWMDPNDVMTYVDQGLPIAPPLHPSFLVGLWLTGLTMINADWLFTFTPKGREIFSILTAAEQRFKSALKANAENQKFGPDSALQKRLQTATARDSHGDWEAVFMGTIYGAQHKFEDIDSDSDFHSVTADALSSALRNTSWSSDGDGGDGGGD